MKLPSWLTGRCRTKEESVNVPTEEEGRQARAEAEKTFRDTTARWEEVHDATRRIEEVRRQVGPDPFVAEIQRAWRPGRHGREAT